MNTWPSLTQKLSMIGTSSFRPPNSQMKNSRIGLRYAIMRPKAAVVIGRLTQAATVVPRSQAKTNSAESSMAHRNYSFGSTSSPERSTYAEHNHRRRSRRKSLIEATSMRPFAARRVADQTNRATADTLLRNADCPRCILCPGSNSLGISSFSCFSFLRFSTAPGALTSPDYKSEAASTAITAAASTHLIEGSAGLGVD